MSWVGYTSEGVWDGGSWITRRESDTFNTFCLHLLDPSVSPWADRHVRFDMYQKRKYPKQDPLVAPELHVFDGLVASQETQDADSLYFRRRVSLGPPCPVLGFPLDRGRLRGGPSQREDDSTSNTQIRKRQRTLLACRGARLSPKHGPRGSLFHAGGERGGTAVWNTTLLPLSQQARMPPKLKPGPAERPAPLSNWAGRNEERWPIPSMHYWVGLTSIGPQPSNLETRGGIIIFTGTVPYYSSANALLWAKATRLFGARLFHLSLYRNSRASRPWLCASALSRVPRAPHPREGASVASPCLVWFPRLRRILGTSWRSG